MTRGSFRSVSPRVSAEVRDAMSDHDDQYRLAEIPRCCIYSDNFGSLIEESDIDGEYCRWDTVQAEVTRLTQEIADAREACPSIRQQANFDAPLLALVKLEVSRGFTRDSQLESLRQENGTLQQAADYLRKERADLEVVATALAQENARTAIAADVLGKLLAEEQAKNDQLAQENERLKAERQNPWWCGCGHTNGCNLAVCAFCGRKPSETPSAAPSA